MEDTTQGIPIFPPRTDQKLETIEFDIQKVQEHLEKLKETKSSGPYVKELHLLVSKYLVFS
jgi:hypothetical protein